MIFFLELAQVEALHDDQIERYGGLPGVRDRGGLEGMVARVQMQHYYDNVSDLFELAAAYLLAVSRGHCFSDANKRTALACAEVFLLMNGIDLTFPPGLEDYIAECAQGLHDRPEVAGRLRQLAAP
ncbi:type II toxin-antitoxin system death-on-curing family toxin [Pantoea latae]|uniref:Death-on-curing protein n=1 Tax=Pantoea latae TaxID=1964541 RepID=A0A1V9DHF7_9GAMM|nr:type II toxin-antitoxin system death-on-curing family toxin [Pantoea latae]OQP33233.1 death-on-curing protein [Pantoea latae]